MEVGRGKHPLRFRCRGPLQKHNGLERAGYSREGSVVVAKLWRLVLTKRSTYINVCTIIEQFCGQMTILTLSLGFKWQESCYTDVDAMNFHGGTH